MGGSEDGELLRSWRLDLQQLRFMCWKSTLQKTRGWLQTVAEVVSPLLVMLALVWAFHLSKVTEYTERIYAGDMQSLARNATNMLFTSLENADVLTCLGQPIGNLSQKLPALAISTNDTLAKQYYDYRGTYAQAQAAYWVSGGYPDWLMNEIPSLQVDPGAVPAPPDVTAAAQQAGKDFVDAVMSVMTQDTLADQVQSCMQQAAQALTMSLVEIYMEFINNKGPLPVFTLDEYLLISRAVNRTMESNPQIADVLWNIKRDFGQNWLGNLLGTGQIAFTPDTPEVRALADYLSRSHVFFKDVYMGILPRDDIERMAADGFNFWAVVDFAYGPVPGGSADYTIRMSFMETPETYITINKFDAWTSKRYKKYITSGFFSIEAAINAYVLGWNSSMEASLLVPQTTAFNVTWLSEPRLRPNLTMQPYALWATAFPKPAFRDNPFYKAVGPMLGLLMCLSMLLPFAMLIRGIVEEKEQRVREVLVIMGLKPWVLKASWIITYALLFFTISVLVVLVVGTTFLSRTSTSLLLVYLTAFCMSELAFGVMLSTLFSRAKVSAVVGPLAHFALVMPRYAFYKTAPSQALMGKLASCLMAPSAFTFGMDVLASYEGAGRGMTWSDIWSDPLPLGATLCMIWLDTALYFLLASYLDKIVSSGYGPTLPCYFIFQPKYWKSWWASVRQVVRSSLRHTRDDSPGEGTPLLGTKQDSAPVLSAASVDIRHLHMRYPNGVHAVRDVSMRMYPGQITALLGHNGAGKSTTVAMMTGLMMPSSGDVIIAGHSMVHDTDAARQSLGLCPQHEVLLTKLSVKEHLVLLAAIKGVPGWGSCTAAAAAMRATIGLGPNDDHAAAATLSGGMKRKLQMGMALIGGSKVVIADEPTSGMDPTARRGLWALLRAAKTTRSILITTHYMDEADLLADNIVILSRGRLCAQGSGNELKDSIGGAYTLNVTLQPPQNTSTSTSRESENDTYKESAQHVLGSHDQVNGSVANGSSEGAKQQHDSHAAISLQLNDWMAMVCVLIERVVGQDIELVRTAGTELVLRLPSHASGCFAALLEEIEAAKKELHVSHYSICMPTLEEVFLRVISESSSSAVFLRPGNKNTAQHVQHGGVLPAGSHRTTNQVTSSFGKGGIGDIGGGFEMGSMATPPPGNIKRTGSASNSSRASAETVGSGVDLVLTVQDMKDDDRDIKHNNKVVDGMTMQQHGASPVNGNERESSLESWKTRLTARSSGQRLAVPEDHQSNSARGHAATSGNAPRSLLGVASGASRVRVSSSNSSRTSSASPLSWWTCFKLMYAKRATISSRDWKGLLTLFLLPIAAVALTLIILILNIDPTGPSLTLSLHSLEQYTPIPMGHTPAPGILTGCLGPAHPLPVSDLEHDKPLFEGWVPKYDFKGHDECPNGMAFMDLHYKNVTDSFMLSEWLLEQQQHNSSLQPPQYAAMMWADPTVLKTSVKWVQAFGDAKQRVIQDFADDDVDATTLFEYIDFLSNVPNGIASAISYAARSQISPDRIQQYILPMIQSYINSGGAQSQQQGDSAALGSGRRRLAAVVGRGLMQGITQQAQHSVARDGGGVAGAHSLRRLLQRGPTSVNHDGGASGAKNHSQALHSPSQGSAQAGAQSVSLPTGAEDRNAASPTSPTGFPGTFGFNIGDALPNLGNAADTAGQDDAMQQIMQLLGNFGLGGSDGQLTDAELQQYITQGLIISGVDSKTAASVADMILNLDDPAVRDQLITLAAGSDPDLDKALRNALSAGPPETPDQILVLIKLLLGGPLGDGLRSKQQQIPNTTASDPDPYGTDNAAEAWLAQQLATLLGLEDPQEAQDMLDLLLPVLLAAGQGGGDSQISVSRLLSVAQELSQVQGIVTNMMTRLRQPPVTLLFNATSYHSMMAAYTDFQQALANLDMTAAATRAAAVGAAGVDNIYNWQGNAFSKDLSTKDRTIRVTNHPLPLTRKETLAIDTFLSILAAIFVMIPFCYLAGAYCVSPVSEGRSGSRSLQVSSGCPRGLYWAGSMTWDLTLHAAVAVLSLATFAAFGDASTTGGLSQATAALLLIFGYGAGCIPLSYCMSLGFSSPSSAQVSISAINFVLGFMFVVGSETMKGIPDCIEFQKVAVHFCRLLPPFNLGEGLISLSTYRLYTMLQKDLEPQADGSRQSLDSIIPEDAIPQRSIPNSPFDWDILGRNLVALYGSSVAYFLLIWFLDSYRNDPYLKISISSRISQMKQQIWEKITQRSGSRRGAARGAALELHATAADTSSSAEHGSYSAVSGTDNSIEAASLLGKPAGTAASRGVAGGHAGVASVANEEALSVDEDDEDVQAERQRVTENQSAQFGRAPDVLSILGLRKVYPTKPPKIAVKDLCLGVAPGERFGFLGANGAGKSSTLRILSGQAAPTAGDVRVAGFSVVSPEGAATARQKLVGYCPQVDPLLDLLTSWEQLQMYACLKGVPAHDIDNTVRQLLARVGLPVDMWHRASGTLSGGNKRKLSLAMALVGHPSLVLLDEPSSGMDPGARRMMWDAILNATSPAPTVNTTPGNAMTDHTAVAMGTPGASSQPAALVLTTHYLEEAEALCDRVGIMTKGKLMCVGGSNHLKSRFGAAYAIELRCAPAPTLSVGIAQSSVSATARNNPSQFPLARLASTQLPPRPSFALGSDTENDEEYGDHGATPQHAQHGEDGNSTSRAQHPLHKHGMAPTLPLPVSRAASIMPLHSTHSMGVTSSLTQLERQEVLLAEINAQLPDFRGVEVGWGSVKAALPITPATPSMAAIFKILEWCKQQPHLGLVSYSVSQPSLEAVFLRVCGHKLDEQGEYLVE